MAIRDRFRRALHKSGSSESISPSDCSSTAFTSSTRRSSSSETSSPVGPIKSASSLSSSSSPPLSRLSKTFSFGSRDRGKDKESKQAQAKAKAQAEASKPNKGKTRPSRTAKTSYQHPSQRPLTEQNLRHQEMLGRFTMTFGTSNLAQLEVDDYDGVSPCCTRPCSRDG